MKGKIMLIKSIALGLFIVSFLFSWRASSHSCIGVEELIALWGSTISLAILWAGL